MPIRTLARAVLAVSLLAALACGNDTNTTQVPGYEGTPPRGTAITPAEATAIPGAPGWTWVAFPDSVCTNAVRQPSGAYQFGTSPTGLAVRWGTSTDLVVFLQGGGACWDFFTCGGAAIAPAPYTIDKTATAGPFGPNEFVTDVYALYPNSWVHPQNLPAALANATMVFVPYCTGDVHSGDKITTYPSPIQGLPSVTWHHAGHANVMAFLKRLGATFPSPGKVVVSGSSAGGFGSLANYPAFRWYWPNAKMYLVDDSGPPLAGNAIPATTRAAWYANWNMGASLDPFCASCRNDMSAGMRALASLFPQDRMALLSHLQDGTIRTFFGTISTAGPQPMAAATFETALRALGTTMDPGTANQKYFFTNTPTPTRHPILDDPTLETTPAPGVAPWIQDMVSDAPGWASKSD
jgi:hypothetical protein